MHLPRRTSQKIDDVMISPLVTVSFTRSMLHPEENYLGIFAIGLCIRSASKPTVFA